MDSDLKFAIDVLREIPHINEGGCAIAALSIYRYLVSKNKKCKIIFCYEKYDYFRFIDNKKQIGNSCSHAVIKFKNNFYDSDGKYNALYYQYYHGVSLDVVIRAINKDVWNDGFSRRYIGRIEKRLDILLSDVKRKVY